MFAAHCYPAPDEKERKPWPGDSAWNQPNTTFTKAAPTQCCACAGNLLIQVLDYQVLYNRKRKMP